MAFEGFAVGVHCWFKMVVAFRWKLVEMVVEVVYDKWRKCRDSVLRLVLVVGFSKKINSESSLELTVKA